MKDIDSLTNAMLEVYKNKNIKKELIESSKKILNNFTQSKYTENLLEYIKNRL